MAQTLQMLEDDDLAAMGHNSTEYIHLLTQALNLAYADRHAYYGDPDLVDVPIEGLLSKGYTRSRRADVNMTDAFPEMPEPATLGRIRVCRVRRASCRHGNGDG